MAAEPNDKLKSVDMIERRRFLLGLAATAFTPPLLGANNKSTSPQLLERALVLSGGGARGAYEAGIVGALAAADGVSDGMPLPGYGLVAGTSIGALNGWFVATGQYQRMRELWYGISGANPVKLKPQFAALRDPESGVLNKARSALSFVGLARNVQGLFQTEPAFAWIVRHIDPATPLLVPLAWAVTNLDEQRPEYFFIRPRNAGEELHRAVVRELQLSLGPQTIVREATPDLLQRAIFASVAIPIAFDPVMMPDSEGNLVPYCDGGVASNSPVGIAHAMASAADVVLLDPPLEPEPEYQDAIDIVYGTYATMQRKIVETEMRSAYFQSVERNTLSRLTPDEIARATNGNAPLVQFLDAAPATTLRYIRPKETLPVGVVDFDDEVGIGRAYRQGWEDISRGFTVYDWKTFEV
jgi:predicted acylesterase/phospholipase RssA